MSGFVFVLTVSFFSSDFYLFLNVISQPVNSRYIGLNLEGKYNHIRVNTKKRLEFKTNMSLDAIWIQSGINSFIFLEMDTQKQIVNIFGYLPTICLVSSFSPMSENASQNGRYISRVTVTSDAFASELKSSILKQKIRYWNRYCLISKYRQILIFFNKPWCSNVSPFEYINNIRPQLLKDILRSP